MRAPRAAGGLPGGGVAARGLPVLRSCAARVAPWARGGGEAAVCMVGCSLPQMPPQEGSFLGIRSVLVIPFADGIGDFINMQPLLAVIRARFPEAAVSVAVSEHGGFLCNDPAIR